MQFERLVIDAGAESFTIDFHERLTVLAGVGRLEREGLVNELIGALGDGRSGVHLEMVSDAGNRFAIFRPAGASHRVIDIDSAADVSDRFRTKAGTIDLLARVGVDAREAKRRMRITPDDLHTASETDRYVNVLARVEQGRLWDLAEKVLDRERRLDEEAAATGSAPEDADIVAEIEELHRRAEALAEQHEKIRSWSIWGAFGSIVSAVPVAIAVGATAAFPFILAAVAATATSFAYFKRLEEARKAETDALGKVGANSYLNFHLQRVNSLLSSDQGRRRLMSAAEEHRAALAQWKLIAGEIPVQWAVDHRDRIRSASAMRRTTNQIGRVAQATPEVTADVVRDVSAALLGQLGVARSMGPGGESFPAILDDPFTGLQAATKPELLALVAKASVNQQIILLTEDPEIAAWARVETLTGTMAVIEPSTAEDPSHHPRDSRHVAA